jgi:predicted methyltransferase
MGFWGRSDVACVSILLGVCAAACGAGKPAAFPPAGEDIPAAPPALPPCPQSIEAHEETHPAVAAEQGRPQVDPLAVSQEAAAVVDASDRTDADRQLDDGRHPGELLTYLALVPGMRAAELVAGTGYTTELLARTVGPKGRVWAENPAAFLKFVGEPFKERLAGPALKNVIRSDLPLESPLPPDAKNLDAVLSVLVYHDTVWLGVDRDRMNKAVFDALKKGGEYVIVDHSAAPGHGVDDVKTLHRIEEDTVEREVLRAGFQAAGGANFLRNSADSRDWNDSPKAAADKRGTSDRFVLKFVRP